MTPRSTTPAEFAPIFDWSPLRRRKLSLISFIVASTVLHLFCFYVFQIVYPPTVALLPPPARVNLITPASEEGRVLLRWIEAEDPALASMTQRSADSASLALPKPEHVPTFLQHEAVLKELPPYQPDLSIPSSRPPGPVPLPRASAPSAASITPTSITFSSEIDLLGEQNSPPLSFTASTRESRQAAHFRIGIGSRGDVRNCFLQVSSGDRELDEQARHYLLLSRFSSPHEQTTDTLTWTTATVTWGSDVQAPRSAPAEPPAP